ncbi:hypothetical protein AALO_G00203100 [Alosa alosa]|uniref:BEN domain-containing protein n=1 Tax=Alosa alosa TaxID=278164 RepID=A0AAV6G3L3_9TELE|nr:hypothetical protein AALO_G00203100 [Alosa alosa]
MVQSSGLMLKRPRRTFFWPCLRGAYLPAYTGKQSNAFRTKAAKPQLNPVKVSDIINYITKRFGVDQLEVKKAISEKCADQEKMEKRRTH